MQQSHLLCFLPCNIKAFNPMLQAVQITTAFPQLHCDHHDQMHHDRQHHKHPTTRIRNSYFYSVLHAPSLFPWILKKLSTNENSAIQPAGIAFSSSWIIVTSVEIIVTIIEIIKSPEVLHCHIVDGSVVRLTKLLLITSKT